MIDHIYRYERKFVISSLQYELAKNKIELDGWTKLFPKRTINNIYLDNISLDSYHQTNDGDLRKEKIRIRWYGHTFPFDRIIRNPILEFKVKKDNLNYKISKPMESIEIFIGMPLTMLKKEIFCQLERILNEQDNAKMKYKEIQFINNYEREYFINKTSNVRLTIDSSQNYFHTTPVIKHSTAVNSIVIELKYNLGQDFNNFVIRTNLIQNSKYKNGVDLLS